MNRSEVIIQIAQICALSHGNITIGVLLPTYEDVKMFKAELLLKLNEIPTWLCKPLITATNRLIETDNFTRVCFLHSVHHAKGQSFNSFYLSSRLTEKQKSQYIFDLLPAMVHAKPIITFEDGNEEV